MSASPVLSEPLWRLVPGNLYAIEVNLAAEPRFTRQAAGIAWRWGRQTGWGRIEFRNGVLYQDGCKVELHREFEQLGAGVHGLELKERLQFLRADSVIHPNVGIALIENPHMIPEDWKVEIDGVGIHIHFWAVGAELIEGGEAIGCVYLDGDEWFDDYTPISDLFGVRRPTPVAT